MSKKELPFWLRLFLHTEHLAALLIGVFVQGWALFLTCLILIAALIAWWRIYFAIRRLTGDGSGPQLVRDARNLALCSGAEDEKAEAGRILETRELPPLTFGLYFNAFWFSFVPMTLIAAICAAIRWFLA